MKPRFRPQDVLAGVGCAAVAIMGAVSVAAATGQSSAQPGGSQPTTTTLFAPAASHGQVTTTTTSNMSFRPVVTATVPAPPT